MRRARKPVTRSRWFVLRHVYGQTPTLVGHFPDTNEGAKAARALVVDTLKILAVRLTWTEEPKA